MKLGAWGGPSTHWPQPHSRVWDVGGGQPNWKCGWSRNEEALAADGFSGGCHEFYSMGKTLNPNRLLLSKVCSSPDRQASRAASWPGLHGRPWLSLRDL